MITIVSGFGRCGSSLVMQMLDAGGMPTTGTYPAFEHEIGSLLLTDRLTLPMMLAIEGKAVKLLDPHRGHIPVGPRYKVIWLTRTYGEQSRSQVKFLNAVSGLRLGRKEVRQFKRSYINDKSAAVKALLDCKPDGILDIHFERVLADPLASADQIISYLAVPLDREAMASVVIPRGPLCTPNMNIELSLIDRAKSRVST